MSEESSKIVLAEFLAINEALEAAVYLDNHGDETLPFQSLIKQIQDDSLLIDVPQDPGLVKYMQPGAKIDLAFLRIKPGPVAITARVINYQEAGRTGAWVQVPPNFIEHFLKRRLHVRVSINFPVKVHATVDKQHPVTEGECINLSGGGMRFTTLQVFLKGEHLTVEFQPDPLLPPFKAECEVVQSGLSPYPNKKSAGEMICSVKFNGLSRHAEDMLVGICFRQQLKQRHLQP